MALSPDHLVYAAPDLDKAVDKLTALLGVRPSAGGQHPNGTHNALLSLNQSCYLEVIAPDPAQCSGESGEPLAFGLDELHVGKLTTWAVLAPSLEEVAQAAQAAGYDPGVIVEGGRTRPDGVELRWRTTKRPEAQESWPASRRRPGAVSYRVGRGYSASGEDIDAGGEVTGALLVSSTCLPKCSRCCRRCTSTFWWRPDRLRLCGRGLKRRTGIVTLE